MRYIAAEKLESIQVIERSSLSVRRTLAQLDIPKSTLYAWYGNYLEGGPEALEDRPPAPSKVWNKLPEEISQAIVEMALAQPQRAPLELAVAFTDERGYFLWESTVYRLLKARNMITSPALILMQAAERFAPPAP